MTLVKWICSQSKCVAGASWGSVVSSKVVLDGLAQLEMFLLVFKH